MNVVTYIRRKFYLQTCCPGPQWDLKHTKMVAWCLSLLNTINKKEKTQTPHPPRSLANKTGRKPLSLLAPIQEKVFLKMTSTHKQQHPQDELRRALSLHTPCLEPMWAPLTNTLCHHSLPNNSALKLSQKPNMSASESWKHHHTAHPQRPHDQLVLDRSPMCACRELTIDTLESFVPLPTSVF